MLVPVPLVQHLVYEVHPVPRRTGNVALGALVPHLGPRCAVVEVVERAFHALQGISDKHYRFVVVLYLVLWYLAAVGCLAHAVRTYLRCCCYYLSPDGTPDYGSVATDYGVLGHVVVDHLVPISC